VDGLVVLVQASHKRDWWQRHTDGHRFKPPRHCMHG